MGIVLEIPELAPVVSDTRSRYDWTAAAGFPPHVTLIGGTLYEGPSNEELLRSASELGAMISRASSFDIQFSGFHLYPGALVMPVDPNPQLSAFAAAISTVCGVECRPNFHSTVARASEEELAVVEQALITSLPVTGRALRVLVIGGDSGGGESRVFASWLIGSSADVGAASAASAP